MLLIIGRFILAVCCIIEAVYIPMNILVGVQSNYIYGHFAVITSFFYIMLGLLLLIESVDLIDKKLHHSKHFFITNFITTILFIAAAFWSHAYADKAFPMILIALIVNGLLFLYSYRLPTSL